MSPFARAKPKSYVSQFNSRDDQSLGLQVPDLSVFRVASVLPKIHLQLMTWVAITDAAGPTTGTGELRGAAQASVSRPSFLSLYSPVFRKSTSILDPNASESCSLSLSILGYCLGSPPQPSPPEQYVGGRLQIFPHGMLRTGRVSFEGRPSS